MIIIQLLKGTKYPANYQIIIDSSLGNYAVLRDFFSALHRHSKPFGPSAPIAYATSVSPPNEAAAWPGAQFLQITAHTNSTFPSS